MAKTLQLQFVNEEDKIVTLSVDDPIEPVNPAGVNAAMDTIIASNAFFSAGGNLVEKKGAKLVDRVVEEITL